MLNLFDEQNLLPCDGEAVYSGPIFNQMEANGHLEELLRSIEWKNDEAMMFGKHIITKRKVAWYADFEMEYTYSKITKRALPWTPLLLDIKRIAEKTTGSTYNACLLNLYHDGAEGMAWHSDDEKALAPNASIASLSFGAERKFAFKHKTTGETVSVILQHGSLLEMKGPCQTHWLHRLPPTTKINRPRVNLTFRKMITEL